MDRIELNNFRCYEHFEIDFQQGINLLIGDNGSGKTSLLKACKYAMSTFFIGFSDENTKLDSPSGDDFRMITAQDGSLVGELPIDIKFAQGELFPGAQGLFSVQKRSKKNSRALVTGVRDYKDAAKHLLEAYYETTSNGVHRVEALPLFVSFSTDDIHSSRKIKANKFKNERQKPSFGYYECLNCNGLLKYWQQRLLALAEFSDGEAELEIVKRSVLSALGEDGCGIIRDMTVYPNRRKIVFRLMDGRETDLDMLSDGHKRLVNIVVDVAFRCALLNKGMYGAEAARQTQGTVLIDEIDMHLHPALQSKVLHGLQQAFPMLQFIVTTHAPMVMTGVENNSRNVVYKMTYTDAQYGVERVNTYGLDATQILQLVMDVLAREVSVDGRLRELFGLIDNGNDGEALQLLDELQEQFHDTLPELVQARAMLNFNAALHD